MPFIIHATYTNIIRATYTNIIHGAYTIFTGKFLIKIIHLLSNVLSGNVDCLIFVAEDMPSSSVIQAYFAFVLRLVQDHRARFGNYKSLKGRGNEGSHQGCLFLL